MNHGTRKCEVLILLGLDGRFVTPRLFPVACGFGTWLLTLGFTLAYGAMFSKIWRVHWMASKSKDGPSQPPQSQQRVPAQIKVSTF